MPEEKKEKKIGSFGNYKGKLPAMFTLFQMTQSKDTP